MRVGGRERACRREPASCTNLTSCHPVTAHNGTLGHRTLTHLLLPSLVQANK